MTDAEFVEWKRQAHALLDRQCDQARRDRRFGELYIGASWNAGTPGDLIVTGDQRHRVKQDLPGT